MTEKQHDVEFHPDETFEPNFIDDEPSVDEGTDDINEHAQTHESGEQDAQQSAQNEAQAYQKADDKFKKYALWGGAAFLGLGALGITSVLLFSGNGAQQPSSAMMSQINQQRMQQSHLPQQKPVTLEDQARKGLVAQDARALEELKRQAQLAQQKHTNNASAISEQPQVASAQNTVLEPAQRAVQMKVEGAAIMALPSDAFKSVNLHIDEAKSEIVSKLSSMQASIQHQDKKMDVILKEVRKTKQFVKAVVHLSAVQKSHSPVKRKAKKLEEKPVSPIWRVKGIELGAAVMQNVKTGTILVVMPGDVVSGLGLIKKIDPEKGIVIGERQIAEGDIQV